MGCRSCMSLLCLTNVALSGARGVHGNGLPHAAYTLNLQPPEESTHDVLASLDAIMKAEDERRKSSDEAFAEAKQRLLDVEKQQIEAIVREAFDSGAWSA